MFLVSGVKMAIKFSVEAFKRLRKVDFRVLNAIERGMAQYLYVPVREISRLSGLDEELVEKRLKALNSLGLVQRRRGAHTGYILTSRGYDCLALNTFVKRGVLESISAAPLGVGKEADVYVGLTPGGVKVAVKFHRAGRTSFRGVRIKRVYVGDREHLSWLYLSRLAAKTEYEALHILFPAKVRVPKPIDWNRHVVVTSYVEGVELSEAPPLDNPRSVMDRILEEMEKAYKAGVVHGDLSEYNVLIDAEEDPVIFDWPQWVSPAHPSAPFLLRRDVENILKFFKRKYHLSLNPTVMAEEICRKITGGGGGY